MRSILSKYVVLFKKILLFKYYIIFNKICPEKKKIYKRKKESSDQNYVVS